LTRAGIREGAGPVTTSKSSIISLLHQGSRARPEADYSTWETEDRSENAKAAVGIGRLRVCDALREPKPPV
jgi:hypothetical protein